LEAEDKLHVNANTSSSDALGRAGTGRARALVTAADSDERNVYITLASRAARWASGR